MKQKRESRLLPPLLNETIASQLGRPLKSLEPVNYTVSGGDTDSAENKDPPAETIVELINDVYKNYRIRPLLIRGNPPFFSDLIYGIKSGDRSVIVAFPYDEGGQRTRKGSRVVDIKPKIFKIKGCAFLNDLPDLNSSDNLESILKRMYTNSHDGSLAEPEGGQFIYDALSEVEITSMFNDIMKKEGFLPAQEPAGVIKYPAFFSNKEDLATASKLVYAATAIGSIAGGATGALCGILENDTASLNHALNGALTFGSLGLLYFYSTVLMSAEDLLWMFRSKNVQLASSVMEVRDDARLVEILSLPVENESLAKDLVYALGLNAGAQKRISDEHMFAWSIGNSHVGNYVIFKYDKTHNYNKNRDRSSVEGENNSSQSGDDSSLLGISMVDFEDSYSRHPYFQPFLSFIERVSFLRSVRQHNMRLVGEAGFEPLVFDSVVQSFLRGFKEGYQNPNKRPEVRYNDLRDAFRFPLYR